MAYRVARFDELEWTEREPEGDAAPRYVARLSDVLRFEHTRSGMWRYPPNSKGRRHKDTIQEETFVVVDGTLTMYLNDPPERVDVPKGSVVHVESGTVLQLANHGDEDVLVYAYGAPPEQGGAEFFDSAV
jgi:mannose-6-phosphate isomerase-like protein (cupin superfamily)